MKSNTKTQINLGLNSLNNSQIVSNYFLSLWTKIMFLFIFCVSVCVCILYLWYDFVERKRRKKKEAHYPTVIVKVFPHFRMNLYTECSMSLFQYVLDIKSVLEMLLNHLLSVHSFIQTHIGVLSFAIRFVSDFVFSTSVCLCVYFNWFNFERFHNSWHQLNKREKKRNWGTKPTIIPSQLIREYFKIQSSVIASLFFLVLLKRL